MRNWLGSFKKRTFKKESEPVHDPWRLADLTSDEKEILEQVGAFTMTGPERLVSLIRAVRHLVKSEIAGSLVECGVWKGGSAMAMALALMQAGDQTRDLYLYDTYEGMSEPTPFDRTFDGRPAEELLHSSSRSDARSVWCYSTLEEVRLNLEATSYPADRIHFIKGKVEDTLTASPMPDKIALLRLDTDWYESTRHEMEHLYPRLAKGGILLIDDYGHWEGCRRAVDEYFNQNEINIFLSRVDYTCRLAVKP